MAINYTPSTLGPLQVAHISGPVEEGDAGDGTDPGIRRAIEQANYSAAKRPDTHYNLFFSHDDWDGSGNTVKTIPLAFAVSSFVAIDTDIYLTGNFSELRFGQELVVGASTTCRLAYSLTDEDTNNHSFNVDVADGATGDGSEKTHDVDLESAGLEFHQWINVVITLSFVSGSSASEIRTLRCQDVEMSGTPYVPVDE